MLTPTNLAAIETELLSACPCFSQVDTSEWDEPSDVELYSLDVIPLDEYWNRACTFLLLILEAEGV